MSAAVTFETIRAANRRALARRPLPVPPLVLEPPRVPLAALTPATLAEIAAHEALVALVLLLARYEHLTPRVDQARVGRALDRLWARRAPTATRVVQDYGPRTQRPRVICRVTVSRDHQALLRAGTAHLAPRERVVGPLRPRRPETIDDRKRGMTFDGQTPAITVDGAHVADSAVSVAPGQEFLIEKQYVEEANELTGVQHVLDDSPDSLGDEGLCRCGLSPAKCVCGDPVNEARVASVQADPTNAGFDPGYAGFDNALEREESLREQLADQARRYRQAWLRATRAADPADWARGKLAQQRDTQAQIAALRTADIADAADGDGVARKIRALEARVYAIGQALAAPFDHHNYEANAARCALVRAHERLEELTAELGAAMPTDTLPLGFALHHLWDASAIIARERHARRAGRALTDLTLAEQRADLRLGNHLAALAAPAVTPDLKWAAAHRRATLMAELIVARASGQAARARALARAGRES